MLRESSPQALHHFTRFDQVDLLVKASEATADTGFMARLMMLCSLPRTNPGTQLQYKRVNGPYTLIMTAVGQTGLPFGNLSRLLLAWVCTEAVRTQSRELFLGASLSGFMRKLDMAPIGGGSRGERTRLRNQMKRLFNAHIQLAYEDRQVSASVNSPIASRTGFWWNERRPGNQGLWDSQIELGEKFFNEIIRHPVPLDLNILKALRRSSLGLDLYLWLTYRAFTLRHPLRLSWARLYRQFGVDPAKAGERVTVDNFRKDCLRELKKIKVAWTDLNYVTAPGALVLRPSKPAVPRAASSRRVAFRSRSLDQDYPLVACEAIGGGRKDRQKTKNRFWSTRGRVSSTDPSDPEEFSRMKHHDTNRRIIDETPRQRPDSLDETPRHSCS